MLFLSYGSREKGICLYIPEVVAGHNFRFLLTVSNSSTERRAVPFTESLELPFLPLAVWDSKTCFNSAYQDFANKGKKL